MAGAAPEQALQEFHDRAAKMLEANGNIDKEVLDLLFCVEQATQALKTPLDAQAGPSVPDNAEAAEKALRSNSQGQQHFASRDWRAALSCFSEAAQNTPKEAVYHANMAAAALKMCQYHSALQAAQRALCLSPGDQKVWVREAKALTGLQKWALAEEAWKRLALKASSQEEAATFKAKEEWCREARWKAELEGGSMVDSRPALPKGPVNVSLLAEQMEAARIATCDQPHSQVARAVLVECLIQCGRLQDANAAIENLSSCLHKIYLQAEITLRMENVHEAFKFVSAHLDDPTQLPAPGNNSSPAPAPVHETSTAAAAAAAAAVAAEAPAHASSPTPAAAAVPVHASSPETIAAAAAAPLHASSLAPGSVHTAGQAKLQDLRITCLRLLQLWDAAARFMPDPTGSASMPGQHEEETDETNANHGTACNGSTGLQAQHVQACQALLKAVERHAPHSPLLAKAHCMLAEAWLAGPEGGPRTALQVLSQAPQEEPCVLWTKARMEKALGLTEPAFITLRHLQSLCPRWPGLMPALQQAAAAAAAATAATHSAQSPGCSWTGSSEGGCSDRPGNTERSTGRDFKGGGHSSTSTSSGSGKMSINEAFSLLGFGAGAGGHCFNKADLGRAFRRQAALLHPDSGAARAASVSGLSRGAGGAASAESFIRLREAYELLRDNLR